MILLSKSALTISIRTICIALFAWQFYLLTRNFQEFNVRKDVTHHIPNEIELPEIRIQIPYQFAMDPVILQTKYKSQFDTVCRQFSGKKDCDGHSTSPIFFSKSFGKYLQLSDIASHSYAPDMFIPRIFMAGPKKDPRKSLKLSRAHMVTYYANHLLTFQLNATTMLLNLVYPEKALVEDDSLYAYSSLTPGKQITHGIGFTKHTENLLAFPYKTMCKDYNRRQTFEDCLNANSIDKTGLLFPGTTVSLEKYRQTSGMRFNEIFHEDNGTLLEIYKKCRSLVTQPMCGSVQYLFKMSKTSQDVAKGEEKLIVNLIVSSEYDSLTESKPEFPLHDYLILSGSLISSWFGISLMGQLLVASNLFCLAVEPKSTAVSDNQNETIEPQIING